MENTKLQIIHKSLELFSQYGIRSVSMDDISSALGISKKTLYLHVKDKKHLVHESFEHYITNDESFCCQLLNKTDNAIQQLLDLANHLVSHLSKLNPTTVLDIQKYYPASWKLFNKHRHEFIAQRIQENIELGKSMGLYRPELNTSIVTKLYISLVEAVVNPTLFAARDHALVDVFRQMFDYHIHAMMTPKGKHYFDNHKETLFK